MADKYILKSTTAPAHALQAWNCTKLTKDFDVPESGGYTVQLQVGDKWLCDCPSQLQPCKHVKLTKAAHRAGTDGWGVWEMAPKAAGIRPITFDPEEFFGATND